MLRTSLERLLVEIDPRRQRELHTLVAGELERCKQEPRLVNGSISTSESAAELSGHAGSGAHASHAPGDDYWPAFRAACQPTMPPRVRETALDLVQKMLAHRHMRGNRPIDYEPGEAVPTNAAANMLTEPVSSSVANGEPSSSGVLSVNAAEEPRPGATTASTLTTPVRSVEAARSSTLIDDIIHAACIASPLSSFLDAQPQSPETAVHLQIIKVLLTAVTTPTCEVHEMSLLKCLQACVNICTYSKNPVNQATARAGLTQMLHHTFALMESSAAAIASPLPVAHGATVDATAPVNSEPAAGDPSSMDSLESLHGVQENDATSSADILKRDAFLAFRFLCRLSVKVERAETGTTAASSSSAPATESPDDLSPLVLRTRALALEMIFALLNNAGNVLLTQEPFLTLIRQHLTFSVSKNGVLIHPALFELALSVFLHLLKSYRAPLKAEIEVLFHEIYLFILDNPNSAVKQKLMLLQGIFKMCSNAQLLVDIYLNYDCDMNAASIFERIVVSLGKLVQGSGLKIPIAGGSGGGTRMVGVLAIGEDATSESAILAERKLRTKSLRCLVALVHALADWMKESPREDGTSAAAAEMLDRATAVQSASVSETAGEQLRSPDSVGAASANSGTSETWRSTRASTDTESGGPAFESRPPIVLAGRNVLQTMSLRGNSPMTKSNSFSMVTTGDSGAADAPAPLAHPDDFERVKTKKNQWRQCISKFNESPGKGVAALREAGFLTDDESVCQFLRTTPELDKKAIGDFIGDGKETHIAIMHRFVDSFEFAGIPFIDALRRFLNAFRLPGEAQKIDRIVEAFAARFCSSNPQVFAKADVAYTLAFSILMLNTDLHSTRIKDQNRMNKSDFIRNNRGINDNGDLPDDFLGAIFDEIQRNEIVLDEERTVKELERMTSVGVSTSAREMDKQRREIFRREMKQVEKKSQTMMKLKNRVVAPFTSAVHVDHARSMFDVVWMPLLASLSTVFEECVADNYPIPDEYVEPTEIPIGESNIQIIDNCLMGFVDAIRVTSNFQMDTERDAFVSSLGKLSGLTDLATIKAKNVAAARTLVFFGVNFGNCLDESWVYVLRCISDMDRLQLIGEVERASESQATAERRTTSFFTSFIGAPETPVSPIAAEMRLRRPSIGKLANELNSQSMILMIDRIFANSAKLDGSSIVVFMRCLCGTAEEEVAEGRTFMLHKLIEIAYYNMGRIRLEWTQIWHVLAAFFNNVGCHQDVTIANDAVDSLRQLSMKFLERAELAHFDTHSEFLKPLEHIMRHTPHIVIRDLIIQSMEQMIAARAESMHSGWKTIFSILSRAAQEKRDWMLVKKAFAVLSSAGHEHWGVIGEFFVDYVTCVVEFAFVVESQTSDEGEETIVEGTLRLLMESAQRLTKLEQASTVALPSPSQYSAEIPVEDQFHLKWFPVLSGLSRIILNASQPSIRSKAADQFFDILRVHGRQFSFGAGHWKSILRSVVLPLFEDLKDPERRHAADKDSAIDAAARSMHHNVNGAVWTQTIRRLVELYTELYGPIENKAPSECFGAQPQLDLMTLLSGQHSDNLSQTGIIHLELFVQQNWSHFSDEVWALVTVAVENVVRESIPVELFRFPVASSSRSGSTVASRESVASGAGVGVGMNDSGGSMTSAVVESPLNVQHAIFKCGIHLVVLQFMRDLCLDSDDPAVDVIASIVDGGRQQQQLPVDVRPITALPSELFRRVPREFRCRWIACLHASHAFAHTFNANQPLRMALWKAGMVKQMPNLIKQESLALAVYLSIAFHCYREEGDASSVAIAETSEETLHASRLTDKAPSLLAPSAIEYRRGDLTLDTIMAETNQLLERFARFAAENTRYQRDIASWSSVVVLVYREALGLEWGSVSEATSKDRATHDSELEPLQSPRPAPSFGRFKREHVPLLFRHAVHLLACGVDRADLRRALAAFLERIADVVGKPAFAELI